MKIFLVPNVFLSSISVVSLVLGIVGPFVLNPQNQTFLFLKPKLVSVIYRLC